jgi:hypothetical protein
MTRASRISAAPVVERIGHASGDGDGPGRSGEGIRDKLMEC